MRRRPGFSPARPVLPNPASRVPEDGDGVNLLDDPHAIAANDLFNAAYELMLLVLMRFFVHAGESAAEHDALAEAAVTLMQRVLRPLGGLLTTLPAGPSHPGMTAGPSFAVFPSTHALPHRRAAWAIFEERLQQIEAYTESLLEAGTGVDVLASVREDLRSLRSALEAAHRRERGL